MSTKESIEKKLKEVGRAIGSDELLIERVMSQIEGKALGKPPKLNNKLTIRKLIMHRFTKLATAAAIIMTIFAGIHYFAGSIGGTAPAYGITDVPELYSKARTIHILGWRYFPGETTPDGNEVTPVKLEEWLDLKNGRRWGTTCSTSGRSNVITTISLGELIIDGQYWMRVNHTNKWAEFYKSNKYQQMLSKHRSRDQMSEILFGDISKLDCFVKVGREKVDGVDCDIWEREEIFSVTKGGWRYRHWLSPNTGECKRIQAWISGSGKQQWKLRYEYYKIERDVEIPEGLFAMEVPEGYEARNTKETAMVLELGSPNMGAGGGLVWGTALSFTMSDGSVIWGWNSVDKKSERPQEKLFEGLKFGGPLPKMPIEFNALKPASGSKDIIYMGYHLTYTRKANRLTEWAIYIPDGTPPKNVKQFGYHALCAFNIEREPRLALDLPVPYGLLIETREDFDKWVLGAMAELSDDGKAPENVTYESVLQLTEQIRESLNR